MWGCLASGVFSHDLESYLAGIQRQHVQEHTRDRVPVTRSDQIRFLTCMLGHGMTRQTVFATFGQLASERGGQKRWRRATILDRLQWDVFRWYWRRHQPSFSTFFLNSTAHFQHMYWRNMDPEQFALKPSAQEQVEYGEAVRYGYRKMDALVGECLGLAGRETTVILCTALSQQGCLVYEGGGGKRFYRPVDPGRLFRFAGITAPAEYAPVMSEQFRIYLPNEADAAEACEKLQALRLDGREVMMARQTGNEVFAGCCLFDSVASGAVVVSSASARGRFYELFYDCGLVKSGMHHPDGILWIRTPDRRHAEREAKVPLRQVAPTLLRLFGHPQPEFMKLPPLPEFGGQLVEPEQQTA